MAVITFRCSACKQVLKIGSDKAGRKAKCKCGADVVIPSASEPDKPAPAAPPPLSKADEDDDSGTYGLIGDFSTGAPEEKKPELADEDDEASRKEKEKAKEKAQGPRHRPKAPRARTLLEPEKWKKVCLGLQIISIGLWAWLGAAVLREIPVLIGVFQPPDYAKVRMRWEDPQHYAQLTREGSKDDVALTKPEFMMGLITGNDAVTAGLWLFRIAAIVMLLASLTTLTGYAICLAVPSRFGTKGQATTLLILALLNASFTLVFRLLPAFGAMDYILIPVAVPEVALVDANLEREIPLSVILASMPMLDYLVSFVVMGTFLLEPVLIGSFLRAIGLSMRNLDVEANANGVIRLGLGTAFVMLGYVMVMVTGSSDVLLWFLRLVYMLFIGFYLGQLGWFAVVVMRTPPLILKEIDESEAGVERPAFARRDRDDEEEDDEDDEDEDEDDEDED